jgi:hypothetical protein
MRFAVDAAAAAVFLSVHSPRSRTCFFRVITEVTHFGQSAGAHHTPSTLQIFADTSRINTLPCVSTPAYCGQFTTTRGP